eukprot:8699705-Alexandrium_andersonii.AAC.1
MSAALQRVPPWSATPTNREHAGTGGPCALRCLVRRPLLSPTPAARESTYACKNRVQQLNACACQHGGEKSWAEGRAYRMEWWAGGSKCTQ